MKWVALLLGFFLVIGVTSLYERRPGGRQNPHVWYSDVANETPVEQAQDEADYKKCVADNTLGLCLKPTIRHASVIHIDTRYLKQASGLCVEIDFCIRHGESRVLPCQ